MPKSREFTLSDEVPEAVSETLLHQAQEDWQRRSDAAAAKITIPAAPYRIKGDSEAGCWFVEAAEVERSEQPYDDSWWRRVPLLFLDRAGGVSLSGGPQDHEALIAKLRADRPKAKLVWNRIGRRRRGWRTFARAQAWLREWLEPVNDESVYFLPNGQEKP